MDVKRFAPKRAQASVALFHRKGSAPAIAANALSMLPIPSPSSPIKEIVKRRATTGVRRLCVNICKPCWEYVGLCEFTIHVFKLTWIAEPTLLKWGFLLLFRAHTWLTNLKNATLNPFGAALTQRCADRFHSGLDCGPENPSSRENPRLVILACTGTLLERNPTH